MVADAVFHEGGDEVVAVVVPFAPTEDQALAGLLARLPEDVEAEPLLSELVALALQELVLRTLVHEDGAPGGEGLFADELAGVLLPPRPLVGTEVGGERLSLPYGTRVRAQIEARAETLR